MITDGTASAKVTCENMSTLSLVRDLPLKKSEVDNVSLIKKGNFYKVEFETPLGIPITYMLTNPNVAEQFSVELGIDTTRKLNHLTNAVSTKLNQDFGVVEPKKKRTLTKSIKIEILKRDNYTCVECGATRNDSKLHIHHKMPVSRGGTDEMSNLVTLCDSCNLSIGNRVYD